MMPLASQEYGGCKSLRPPLLPCHGFHVAESYANCAAKPSLGCECGLIAETRKNRKEFSDRIGLEKLLGLSGNHHGGLEDKGSRNIELSAIFSMCWHGTLWGWGALVMSKPSEIVYNNDLIIRDPSEAATLCVFYDRIVLPYTTVKTSRELVGPKGPRRDFSNDVKDWELNYGALFKEGILSRLPAPMSYVREVRSGKSVHKRLPGLWKRRFLECPAEFPPSAELNYDGFEAGFWLDFGTLYPDETIMESTDVTITAWDTRVGASSGREYRTRIITACGDRSDERPIKPSDILLKPSELILVPSPPEIEIVLAPIEGLYPHVNDLLSIHVDEYDSGEVPLIRQDLAWHLLRTDIDIPQIFALREGHTVRDVLVALEAVSTFRYLLPKLRTYHPTQILELREKVKDTREGFTMHLWSLSKGLQERANEGATLDEVARFAESVIKTELMPDYREFHRQLEAMKVEKWGKVLDALGKVAEIDASPLTPKFWALLAKALGLSAVASQSDQKEKLSNRYQAYQFMSYVERSSLNLD
jgi:hypothetical protein